MGPMDGGIKLQSSDQSHISGYLIWVPNNWMSMIDDCELSWISWSTRREARIVSRCLFDSSRCHWLIAHLDLRIGFNSVLSHSGCTLIDD